MSVAGPQNISLRPSSKPLAWALLISLAVHLVALVVIPGAYVLLVALALLANPKKAEQLKPSLPPPAQMVELPLEFVEVDPSLITKEPPKNAKYYSAQNALASNPDPKTEANQPKVDGKQKVIPKTQDIQKPKAMPLQPSFPKPPPKADDAPEAKPKGGPKVGDLAMAKPAEKPDENKADEKTGEDTPKHVRPRTITEALTQKQGLVGEKMLQNGGSRRLSLQSSFDTRATPFGAYDAMLIQAIQQHWFDLIDSQSGSEMRPGKVVVEFNLNYDGSITDIKVVESNVSGLMSYLCQAAIKDPSPFEKWPSDMRRLNASDTRRILFTFFYN